MVYYGAEALLREHAGSDCHYVITSMVNMRLEARVTDQYMYEHQ